MSRAALQLGTALALSVGVLLSTASAAEPSSRVANAYVALDGQVNINTATGAQLQLLPGVGPATAAKILAYRIRRQFAHPTHLMRVKGIGRKTFASMRRYIAIEGETTLHVPGGP